MLRDTDVRWSSRLLAPSVLCIQPASKRWRAFGALWCAGRLVCVYDERRYFAAVELAAAYEAREAENAVAR